MVREHPVSVLLVEDEVLISMCMADTLTAHGFAVHECATADEALRYVSDGGPVDVLFTDVNLPGIDGCELVERVHAQRPKLPVVVTSGRYDLQSFGTRVPQAVFVRKPYNPDAVCRLLAELAGEPH